MHWCSNAVNTFSFIIDFVVVFVKKKKKNTAGKGTVITYIFTKCISDSCERLFSFLMKYSFSRIQNKTYKRHKIETFLTDGHLLTFILVYLLRCFTGHHVYSTV